MPRRTKLTGVREPEVGALSRGLFEGSGERLRWEATDYGFCIDFCARRGGALAGWVSWRRLIAMSCSNEVPLNTSGLWRLAGLMLEYFVAGHT